MLRPSFGLSSVLIAKSQGFTDICNCKTNLERMLFIYSSIYTRLKHQVSEGFQNT